MVEKVAVAISDVTVSLAVITFLSQVVEWDARKFLICLHAEAICVWFSKDVIT